MKKVTTKLKKKKSEYTKGTTPAIIAPVRIPPVSKVQERVRNRVRVRVRFGSSYNVTLIGRAIVA